ncbi:MAG: hypothetical protein JSV86_17250 [Gemmatimonadota bacterium]|nr:MAG: hypothetical protein JSV86_17250 [Gemmatimonadota bacterium]
MRRLPQATVVDHIIQTDGSGDPEWVAHLVRIVREHDDWVHVQMDPTDPRIDFAHHPYDVAEYYIGDTTPVVAADGLIIDGSHRASAAWHTGTPLNVYIPAREL